MLQYTIKAYVASCVTYKHISQTVPGPNVAVKYSERTMTVGFSARELYYRHASNA